MHTTSIEKSITKLEALKKECYEQVENEVYFLSEDVKDVLKQVYFQRKVNQLMSNL